ncbi:ABC transporter ATP-binding protein [Halopelagius longus]|uniref:Cobalamin import ATP-binding protein BtuD n=1 Tax=Halopelagius longus TaxID=1236180 RepID=A0A1H1FZ66_9EURY|nr:ABC transporter ATP-binding protein [Halopelagius longus]RDI69942.1 ABC transporter ATP-binding protein [Halopelagius longus]SDR06200.1 iron complex transport system ATP-binding protein [Halopelagius longus]
MTEGRPPRVERESADGESTERPADGGGTAPPDTTDTAFSGTDLVVGYPGLDEPVIDGESIAVPPDEVTALIGPNGSGKSTLLKGLANKISPDDGTVLLDGRAVDSYGSKELARKLGLLSQENAVPAGISVGDLVERGRYPHTGFFESLSDEDRAAVDDAIRLAGIEHLRERDVDSLSGGQKQLVWIAMALAQDTDVLLLDEPTTFLDPHHQLEVMQIVETLRDESEMTVVLVLHDIGQAARYADNVVALKDGSVYARGPPEEVVTRRLLADVFDIDAAVVDTEYGPQIVPLEPLDDDVRSEDGAAGGGD